MYIYNYMHVYYQLRTILYDIDAEESHWSNYEFNLSYHQMLPNFSLFTVNYFFKIDFKCNGTN